MIHLLLALLLTSVTPPPEVPPRMEAYEWTAKWCEPCKRIKPHVEQLRKDGYTIRVYDKDKLPKAAEAWRIGLLPCIVICKVRNDGPHEVTRIVGYYDYLVLKEMFNSAYGPPPKRRK